MKRSIHEDLLLALRLDPDHDASYLEGYGHGKRAERIIALEEAFEYYVPTAGDILSFTAAGTGTPGVRRCGRGKALASQSDEIDLFVNDSLSPQSGGPFEEVVYSFGYSRYGNRGRYGTITRRSVPDPQ